MRKGPNAIVAPEASTEQQRVIIKNGIKKKQSLFSLNLGSGSIGASSTKSRYEVWRRE
jgi:hypothetical protein